MKKAFQYFVIIFHAQIAYGLTIPDSLSIKLAKATNQEQKALALFSVANYYISTSPDSASLFLKQTLTAVAAIKEEKIKFQLLYKIAQAQMNNKLYADAEKNYFNCIDYKIKLNDTFQLSKVITSLGYNYMYANKHTDGIVKFKILLQNKFVASDDKRITLLLSFIGNFFFDISQPDSALPYFVNALDVSKKINHYQGIIAASNNISNYYYFKGNYDKSIAYILDAIKEAEKKNDDVFLGTAYSNLGVIFSTQGKDEQALHYHKLSVKLRLKEGDKHKLPSVYNNVASAFEALNQMDSSLAYLLKALAVSEETEDKISLVLTQSNLGSLFITKKEYAQALIYFDKSLLLLTQINNPELLANTLQRKAECCIYLNRAVEAPALLNQSIDLCLEMGAKSILRDCYNIFSVYHEKTNNHNESLKYYKMYVAIKDSLLNEENHLQMSDLQTRYETEKKDREIKLLNTEKEKDAALAAEQNRRKNTVILFVFLGLLITAVFSAFLFNRYRLIRQQKFTIESQRNLIQEKNEMLTDSIEYAKTFQEKILPTNEQFEQSFKEHFILYKPKDIVSGDFYWIKKTENKIVVAAIDCTGHGVPGAFMSLHGYNLFEKVVANLSPITAAQFLEKLNTELQLTIRSNADGTMLKFGMDLTLIVIDLNKRTIDYCGAHNPLWLIRNGEHIVYSPNKLHIGSFTDKKFESSQFPFFENDIIYMFTDGYADQLGYAGKKKIMQARLKEMLIENTGKNLHAQKNLLDDFFNNWRGSKEQIDDVLVMGLKLD